MNRRELILSLPAAAALSSLSGPVLKAATPGKARLKPAICAYSFREALKAKTMSYEGLIRLTADLGADGVDMTVYWFPDTSDQFLNSLRRTAYKAAVSIYSIAIRSVMTQPTPELRAKEVAEVSKWVDVAVRLGAGHIRVFGGIVPKGATEDQAADWVAEVLQRSSEYAGNKGVILGLEDHGGITARADTILKIVKKVNSPWVGINLDTGNFKLDPYKEIEMCLSYTANVQMKTLIEGPDGKRIESDWERIVKILAQVGYRGYLALEYEDKEPPETAVPRLIAKLKQLTARYSAG
jgi:L-ribulose-5-phosphate 3-epimerase